MPLWKLTPSSRPPSRPPSSPPSSPPPSSRPSSPPGGRSAVVGTISASTMKLRAPRHARTSAALTSGYFADISSSFLEKMRTAPLASLWSCARCPSYFHSALIGCGQNASTTSTHEVQACASIGCAGTPARSAHSLPTARSPPLSSAPTSAPTSGRSAYPSRTASIAARRAASVGNRLAEAGRGDGDADGPCSLPEGSDRPRLELRWGATLSRSLLWGATPSRSPPQPSMQAAAPSAGSTVASSEMPTAMWGMKVRTNHLSSVPTAARMRETSTAVRFFSTPAPPSSASERSALRTPATPSGAGARSSAWRPERPRSASAAAPVSLLREHSTRSAARLAPVASRSAAVIAACEIPRGEASSAQSGRRRCPPACGSLAGARR